MWRGGLRIAGPAGHTGAHVAEQPFGLQIARPGIFPPTLEVDGSPSVPGLECIGIVLAHLFFRSQTLGELLKHQVCIHGGNAADQDHEHPFHRPHPRCCPAHNSENAVTFQHSGTGGNERR